MGPGLILQVSVLDLSYACTMTLPYQINCRKEGRVLSGGSVDKHNMYDVSKNNFTSLFILYL